MRLQFDHEGEESYEEKRTLIGGAVRRTNLCNRVAHKQNLH